MVAFSIIGVLVLALIFFILRGQNMQRELALTRNTVKSNTSKINYAYFNLVLMSKELQAIHVSRINAAHKKGLIGSGDHTVLSVIMNHFSQIVMDCCEKGSTIEEALTRALNDQDITMEHVREFIKTRPNDVRVAWVKNSVDGFVAACNNLSQSSLSVEATEKKSQ